MFEILRSKRSRIEADSEYLKAVEFKKTFDFGNPKFIENADWVLNLARKRFDLMDVHVRYLDDKADKLIQYSGLVVAVVAVLLGVFGGKIGLTTIVIIGIALLLLVMAVLAALSVRMKFSRPHPPNVQTVFKSVEKADSRLAAQARVSLIYGKAIAANMVVSRVKGLRLRCANALMILGFVVLLIGFGVQFYFSFIF